MIGTVTLNPSIDQRWIVRDLVKDDTNRARSVLETAGGKGINVSKVVREMGGRTRAYALLGGGIGAHLAELARSLDFPLIPVPVLGSTRVNIVMTDSKDHTQTRISAPGPRVRPVELAGMMRILERCRPRPAYWAFGGSLPPGLPPDTYRRMIERLQRGGVPCVLDTDDEALREGVKAKPFMIKPNEHELRRLCGRTLVSVADHARQARRIVQSGVTLVVVSLGPKGALFVTDKLSFRVASIPVKPRSKIGAGDSLIGALLTGLRRGMSLEDAARLGVAASTSAVMREAPRLCRKADIGPIFRRLRAVPI